MRSKRRPRSSRTSRMQARSRHAMCKRPRQADAMHATRSARRGKRAPHTRVRGRWPTLRRCGLAHAQQRSAGVRARTYRLRCNTTRGIARCNVQSRTCHAAPNMEPDTCRRSTSPPSRPRCYRRSSPPLIDRAWLCRVMCLVARFTHSPPPLPLTAVAGKRCVQSWMRLRATARSCAHGG